MRNSVPEAVLANLRMMAQPTVESYMSAPWLTTPFTASSWLLVIGKHKIEINWDVSLGQSLLTDSQHRELLTIFKCWVLLPSHPRMTGGRLHDNPHIYNQVRRIIAFIDYMLLHRESLRLEKHGLRVVTENDIKELLRKLHAKSGFINALYEWPERLSAWLDRLAEASRTTLAAALRGRRYLREMHTPKPDWELATNKRSLIRWRVALFVGGYYRSFGNLDFQSTINTPKIAECIYKDTLLGGAGFKPLFIELGVSPVERCKREKEAVPVSSLGDEIPRQQDVSVLVRALKSLTLLDGICDGVPAKAILAAIEDGGIDSESLRETGRFAIAPFAVVMKNVRNAAEFFYEHGEHIVASYAAIYNASKEAGLTMPELENEQGIKAFLDARTLKLGVNCLSVGLRARLSSKSLTQSQSSIVENYFRAFRANEGLLELSRVLVGSVAFSIGPTTARRQAELLQLPVNGALDESRRNLVFRVGKTGVLDKRQVAARPIPRLVSDEVTLLEQLHRETGTFETGRLFDVPGAIGMRPASKSTFNICLDTFSDYFEVDCDALGRRWYVRQHQNRKFLVLAFYYGTAFGNLHTLRWMLAHSDIEHLWHYLTSTIPGEMLEEAQSYFLTDVLQNHPFEDAEIEMHDDATSQLGLAMERQFGTRKFDVVDTEMLEKFINMSIRRGVEVLPHFFDVGGVKVAKIAVTLRQGARL